MRNASPAPLPTPLPKPCGSCGSCRPVLGGFRRRARPAGRPHRRFGLGHHARPWRRLRPRLRDLGGHLHVPRRVAGRQRTRLRPARPHLPDAHLRRAGRESDPGQRGGNELPPALVARRRDDRLRLRPGRTVEPLAHGCGRRQPAGGPPGSELEGRHPGLACRTGRGSWPGVSRSASRAVPGSTCSTPRAGSGVELVGSDYPRAGWPAPSAHGSLYFHFAPSSERDLVRGAMQIRELDLETGKVYDVTEGQSQQQYQGSSGGAIAPEPSPDGRWLAFARRIPGGTISFKGHRFGPRYGALSPGSGDGRRTPAGRPHRDGRSPRA